MTFAIRPIEQDDLPAVQKILEHWMRDRRDAPVRADNVAEALSRMSTAPDASGATVYVVTVDNDGTVTGVGGLMTEGIDLDLANASTKPAELVNIYAAPRRTGEGIGTSIVDHLERIARERGCDSLMVVSGSRNRQKGYPFWDRRFGKRHRIDADFFGPGAERVVWTKAL